MLEIEPLEHCKILFILIFIFLLSQESFSQKYPDSFVDSLITSGINSIINQDYTKAKNTFQELEEKRPQLPLGKIYLAAVDITKAFDYSEKFDSNSIYKNLLAAKDQSEQLLEKNNRNVWDQYFLALSKGFYSYFQALNKNWLSALSNGLSSVSDFEKCLDLDKNFYEAYTAIGTYKYWKSKKTEFLNWLPFMPNDEETGINYLKISVKHFSYDKFLAINSLIWIYIDQKKFNDAVTLAQDALKIFPNSRLFKWGLARAYQDLDVDESIKVYFDLLNSYSSLNNINRCNKIILMHKIAQLYDKSGKYENALSLCDEILNIKNLSDYENEKLNKRLSQVRKLEIKLNQEISR